MKTEILTLNPKTLKLLEKNARFMRHETMQRLIANLKADGVPTSVPFCTKTDDGHWEVISGNHRVMAAVEAGLETIEVMITHDDLTDDQKKALQLSHNALVGEDDAAVLRELYESIGDVDAKLYTGLDDKTLDVLDDAPSMEGLSMPGLDFKPVTLLFLAGEAKRAKEEIQAALSCVKGDMWAAREEQYGRFLDAVEESCAAAGITNVASGVLLMLDIFERHRDELAAEWYDGSETPLHEGWVPMSSVIGRLTIPASAAAVIKAAIDRGTKEGLAPGEEPWNVLAKLLEQ